MSARRRAVAALLLALAGERAAAQLPAEEYAAHRAALAAAAQEGVVLAVGGVTPVTDFGPFQQLPGFRYLTGYLDADAALVMALRGGQATATWLFTTPMPARRAFYSGLRPDSATLARDLGLVARPAGDLPRVLDSLVAASPTVWHVTDFAAADFAAADSLTKGRSLVRGLAARVPGLAVRDAHPLLNRLRARKSPAELALLRRAAAISSEGHRAAMALPSPGHEYDLQAAVEGAFLRGGAERPAYGSIVGSGGNGTILHYMRNRDPVRPTDVVVIDAGAEYRGYAADVTRSFPVSGRFTPAQRTLYQLVLDAQLAAERNSAPGMSAPAATDSSVRVRLRGLAALGLVESEEAMMDPPWPADCARTPAACRQGMLWMVHGISHGIGAEVHDPAQFYEGDRTFRDGDAFTIEPGLYVSRRALDALPDTPRNRAFVARVREAVQRYEGTGVRIEDSYVIQDGKLERISDAPREVADIEAFMARRGRVVP